VQLCVNITSGSSHPLSTTLPGDLRGFDAWPPEDTPAVFYAIGNHNNFVSRLRCDVAPRELAAFADGSGWQL
jgi:hypothetical protein